jgi:hypothetical protein
MGKSRSSSPDRELNIRTGSGSDRPEIQPAVVGSAAVSAFRSSLGPVPLPVLTERLIGPIAIAAGSDKQKLLHLTKLLRVTSMMVFT